ncbi:polysaccharide pyruvyl transferase family protein [Candidatus Methylocalor cossyra]|uniref:Pyruvyl transferase EpsO n=1 Tax=Candidatus Methylocalor cossyra TaxID=3108543 RepID=A0ABP1C9B7_9GAMM
MSDNPPPTHAAIMAKLSAKLDTLADVIPPGSKIIYLDYPVHFNVGDMLINCGTEAFFQRMRYRVLARLSLFDLCHLDWSNTRAITLKPQIRKFIQALDPKAILVLHGGGNFGDLYGEFQAMREQVTLAFPDRRIVMLPQSLHFEDKAAQKRSLDILTSHRDIHLYFRDRESVSAIREVSPQHGALLPDMAHALWNEPGYSGAAQTASGSLALKRTDRETRGTDAGFTAHRTLDWTNLITAWDFLQFRLVRKSMYASFDRSLRIPAWYWYKLRDRVVKRAQSLFSRYEIIMTDRLHGLILASLLSKRTLFQDNAYGKLSRYVNTWLSDSPLIGRVNRDR